MPQNPNPTPTQTADKPLTEAGAESLFARLLAKFTTAHKPEQSETPPAQPAVEQPQDYSQTIAELRQEYQAAGELVQKLLKAGAKRSKRSRSSFWQISVL